MMPQTFPGNLNSIFSLSISIALRSYNIPLVSCILLQSKLTNRVRYNGTATADRLTLGVVRVWGAGTVKVTQVTLTDSTATVHNLVPDHNTTTQVRGSAFIPV